MASAFAGLAAASIAAVVGAAASAQADRAAPGGRSEVLERRLATPVRGGSLSVVVMEPAGGASGLPLLLLHGASGNLRDPQEAIGRRLAERRRVILVDRPGHGRSDRLGGREMASPARQADAVAEALDRLGVGRAVVVGHSWSGALAANLALDHPSHVAGLVLLAPATHPYRQDAAWYNRVAARPSFGRIFATLARPIASLVFDAAVTAVFKPHPAPPDYVARTEARLLLRPDEFATNAEDLVDLRAFVAHQAPRYGAIAVPTTIMTSDKDMIVSPELHARALHRQIRGSELIVIADAGHMIHWTATDRVVGAIEATASRAER